MRRKSCGFERAARALSIARLLASLDFAVDAFGPRCHNHGIA